MARPFQLESLDTTQMKFNARKPLKGFQSDITLLMQKGLTVKSYGLIVYLKRALTEG
jgi:hypothetical protein